MLFSMIFNLIWASIVFYSMFFVAATAAIGEILSLNPGISYYMEHYAVCSVKVIDKEECKFSAFMLFALKSSVNFPIANMLGLGFDLVSIFLTAFFVVYLPLKALRNFVEPQQDQRTEAEDE